MSVLNLDPSVYSVIKFGLYDANANVNKVLGEEAVLMYIDATIHIVQGSKVSTDRGEQGGVGHSQRSCRSDPVRAEVLQVRPR